MYIQLLVIRRSIDAMILRAGPISNIGLTTNVSLKVVVLMRWVEFIEFVKLLGLIYVPVQVIGLCNLVIIIVSFLGNKIRQT